jgi:hypothetical protein
MGSRTMCNSTVIKYHERSQRVAVLNRCRWVTDRDCTRNMLMGHLRAACARMLHFSIFHNVISSSIIDNGVALFAHARYYFDLLQEYTLDAPFALTTCVSRFLWIFRIPINCNTSRPCSTHLLRTYDDCVCLSVGLSVHPSRCDPCSVICEWTACEMTVGRRYI